VSDTCAQLYRATDALERLRDRRDSSGGRSVCASQFFVEEPKDV
jgi:hypothetical protein